LIYTDSSFKNPNSMDNYPNLKKHLDRFFDVITSYNKPYGLHRTREEQFFKGEKIIVQRKCAGQPSFSYSDFDCYVSATFYVIKTNRFNLKYLVGLLNSKLIAFWLKNKGKMQGDNYQLDKEPLLQIPIFNATKEQQQPIISLVEYILLLYIIGENNRINEYVPNSHLILLFEEVIDALVYELYFKEDFINANISFMQFAGQYFQSIAGKSEPEGIETIHSVYQKLRETDNEIRNNLKLMNIKLANLIMPIKR